MKRAALVLLLALAGCSQNTGAVQALVQFDPALPASCIALDLLSTDGTVLHTQRIDRPTDRNALRVAVFRGALPQDIQLQARALWGQGCNDPLIPNGLSTKMGAHFDPKQVGEVTLELALPSADEDADHDGFISMARGGPDCDDSRAQRKPGVQELCDGTDDLNCDGQRGCDDATCSGKACIRVATSLVFTTPPAQALAGKCVGPVTVERRDSAGTPVAPDAATALDLGTTLPTGLAFYSDAACTSALAAPSIPAGSATLSFYVRSTTPGDGELTAQAPNLSKASLHHTVLAGPAKQLAFTTPARTVTAGDCVPVTVERRDDFANPTSGLAQAVQLALTPSPQAVAYQDSGCVTPVSNLSFGEQDTASTFYFRSTRSGSAEVVATATGLSEARQTQTVNPGAPAKLVLVTPTSGLTLMAGECSAPMTVRITDGFDNVSPLPSGATLTLSAGGAEGFGFFTDAACTSATSALTLPALTSEASFRFKGKTGGSVEVSATLDPLGTVKQTQTVLPAVRRNTCTLANGATSVDCPVSPAVGQLDRSFLLFQATTNNNTPASSFIRCKLATTSSITCSRVGNTGDAIIQWQVAELPKGLKVQHIETRCLTTLTSVTIAAVQPEKAFLLFSSSQDGTASDSNDFMAVQLASTTRVDIVNNGGCNNTTYMLQVVELEDTSVTRGVTGQMTSGTLDVTSLASADTARSMMMSTFRTSAGGDNNICNRMIRSELTSDTSLRFSRWAGGTCDNSTLDAISWERLTAPVGTLVQSKQMELADGSATTTTPLATPVDLSRTLVFSSSQIAGGQGGGETSFSADDVLGAAIGRFQLTSPNQLEVKRDRASGTARWTVYAVQLDP